MIRPPVPVAEPEASRASQSLRQHIGEGAGILTLGPITSVLLCGCDQIGIGSLERVPTAHEVDIND